MYKIKISFGTGDSLHSEDCKSDIEYEWDNLDMANESIKRIMNHYYYTEEYPYQKPKGKIDGVVWDQKWEVVLLELISDEGKPFIYSAFWVGYFEILYSAEIYAPKMIFKP